MKKTLFAKLLVMLLLVSMVLVGCGKQDGGSRPKKTPENVVPVAGKLSDFMKLEYQAPVEFDRVERITAYGELVASESGALLFYEKEKDYLNNVTETYTLYSVANKEVVLTLTNTYADANYGEISDDLLDYVGENGFYGDNFYKRPETELNVEIVYSDDGFIVYLKAERTTNERIPTEEIIENGYCAAYHSTSVNTYYDLAGTEITESALDFDPYAIGADMYGMLSKAVFLNTVVVFDPTTWTVIESYDARETSKLHVFDYEDEYYGYELPFSMMGFSGASSDSAPLGMGGGAVRVYDKKSGEVVISYACDPEALTTVASVLNNGDILLQSLTIVETGGEYDLSMEGLFVNVDSKLIDIDTGAVKSVTVDYFFQEVISRSYYPKRMAMLGDQVDGAMPGITDNVFNMGVGLPLGGSSLTSEDEMVVVFMDSALNVQKALKQNETSYYPSTIPDVEAVLPNGDLLLVAGNPDGAEYVVVSPEGELRYYLPGGAFVAGDYIITASAIYDLDMKKIADHGISPDETIVGFVDNTFYTERVIHGTDPETGDPTETFYVYRYVLEMRTEYNEETEQVEEVGIHFYRSSNLKNYRVSRVYDDEDDDKYEYVMQSGSYIVLEKYGDDGEITYHVEFDHTSLESDAPVEIDKAGDVWYVTYSRYGEDCAAILWPYQNIDDYYPGKGGEEK